MSVSARRALSRRGLTFHTGLPAPPKPELTRALLCTTWTCRLGLHGGRVWLKAAPGAKLGGRAAVPFPLLRPKAALLYELDLARDGVPFSFD